MNVYFIVAEEHNAIKIGTTMQPRKRYRALFQECLPCTIYMIFIPNSPITESELLHKYAKDLYSRKEWFYGTTQLYQEIQYLYDTYNGTIHSNLDPLPPRMYLHGPPPKTPAQLIKEHFANSISGHELRRIIKG